MGKVYSQTNEFVYLGGNVNHNADLSIEVSRRIHTQRLVQLPEVHPRTLRSRPSAPLELKIRMLRAEALKTMLYDCVTCNPHACHYGPLRRAHHSFRTRCIGWRKNNRADYPIFYLDTLIRRGDGKWEYPCDFMQEADLVRGICGTHGGCETAGVRDVRRIDRGGRAAWGGQEKEWMGCFLDDLRAFDINDDQWTTVAQDKGKWRRTAE